MFYAIKGKIVSKPPLKCLLEVRLKSDDSIIFSIDVPLSNHTELKEIGETQILYIYPFFGEKGLQLFGFVSEEDRALFDLLLRLPNVNKGLAMRVLSGFRAHQLIEVVKNKDIDSLINIKGIGKKTAERLLFELKLRLPEVITETFEVSEYEKLKSDAIRALLSLGLKEKEAVEAVEKALKESKKPEKLEDLIKEALKTRK